MSYLKKPSTRHPRLPVNEVGLTRRDYESNVISTLCAGCGHDSISAAIVDACFHANVKAHEVVKLSGIGCSSKTPNYFLMHGHGFNTVHGRMPSVATGAILANKDLVYIGVSGDGDTASIGLGQFCHSIRRRLNMVYIVENNGCYGLTKGQFSATNDKDSPSRSGEYSNMNPIDLVGLAMQLGAGFVARGFSGDKAQLVPLIEAAINYKGFAFIDIVSPCVTFNNHTASTKSFEHIRDHIEALNTVDVVPERDAIEVQIEEGDDRKVQLHDGSVVNIQKLHSDHTCTNRAEAMSANVKAQETGVTQTGLLYIDRDEYDIHDVSETVATPLNQVPHSDLVPSTEQLEQVNQSLR